MKNQKDFIKINHGQWGAINLNNMIPIVSSCASKINIDNLQRSYDITAYKELLKNQLSWCNSNKDYIINKAKALYDTVVSGNANKNLTNRCCNYKLLENKCLEYQKAQNITSTKDITHFSYLEVTPEQVKDLQLANIFFEERNSESGKSIIKINAADKEKADEVLKSLPHKSVKLK